MFTLDQTVFQLPNLENGDLSITAPSYALILFRILKKGPKSIGESLRATEQ